MYAPGDLKRIKNYPLDREKSHKEFKETRGRLTVFAAERATVAVGTQAMLYQVCQVVFQRDGSIAVQCPYFPGREGILSSPTQDPDAVGPITYNLREGGKLTSHLVKLNHHPDGEVHFSQSSKILTAVRRKTFELPNSIGFVFQLHIYFPEAFEALRSIRRGRCYLPFVFQPELPRAIAIFGQWRRRSDIEANTDPPGLPAGPLNNIQDRATGETWQSFFLAQPADFALPNNVLLVSAHKTQELPNIVEPTMILIGGFDPHEVQRMGEHAKQTGCLAWLYPHRPDQESRRILGSVDLPPELLP